MRVLGREKLAACIKQHEQVKGPVQTWFDHVSQATWRAPTDIKASYASASIVTSNCIVFNIKGGAYRLVALVNYDLQVVTVIFVDSHVEYDKINVAKLCKRCE